MTNLLDSIETAIDKGRTSIKTDEAMSTYFKTAKDQMDDNKVYLSMFGVFSSYSNTIVTCSSLQIMIRDVRSLHLFVNKELEKGEDVKRAKLLGPEDADTIDLRLSDLAQKSADLQEAAYTKDSRSVL